MSDFNASVIEQFRANEGRVGPPFEGAPMVLVHHRGRTSGEEFSAPLVYRADDSDPDTVYVFASAAGAPSDPQWYRNLVAAGTGEVEIGTERFAVDVRDLPRDERDRVYAAQVAVMPGFGEYEQKTKGIRTIPVLALTRRVA